MRSITITVAAGLFLLTPPAQAAKRPEPLWPNIAMTVEPAMISLDIFNFGSRPIQLVDRDYGGKSLPDYGLTVRVRDGAGKLLATEQSPEGWWTPAVMVSSLHPADKPPVRTLQPQHRIEVSVAPSRLLAQLPGARPTSGTCRFQTRVVVSLWPAPSTDPGPISHYSGWVPVPCADLFPGR